jgi:hypothetical protein
MTTSRFDNPAFVVAQAEYPGKPLERCSCGCLKPKGEPCPYNVAVRLFEPAPEPMPGQSEMFNPDDV